MLALYQALSESGNRRVVFCAHCGASNSVHALNHAVPNMHHAVCSLPGAINASSTDTKFLTIQQQM